jgi:hypothetical protein
MEILEESLPETETTVQAEGPFQVQSVNKTLLNSLGRKMSKRTGFNVIESAQQRALSDFLFDLDASLLTTDTLKRRTYTVPFLEKGDKYSTFNLVMVADSVDNILDQYVLQYGFDSLQYQTYQQTKDLLSAGVTIKRFPFSSFFNDSSPGFLERCDGVYDANGDPVTCDQVTIDSGSGGGGGGGSGGSGSVWITPGGSSSGDGGSTGPGSGSSGSGSPSSGGGGGGTSCRWAVVKVEVANNSGDYCQGSNYIDIITIYCSPDPYSRKNNAPEGLMTCMDCSVSDFGSPAFTQTRDATAIDNLLGGDLLTDWHLQYLSNNPSLGSELRAALMGDSSIDEDAALFTIAAGMNGAYTGNFNSNFGLAIEGLMTESTADFSNDIIISLFQTYFDINYAILKQQNPSWTPGKLFYEASKEVIHLSLDAIGLIEGLGTPADLLNAGFYYLEGDRLNGTISLVAAIPGVGLFATTSKSVLKLGTLIPGTSKRMSQIWIKIDDGVIEFSGTRFRKVMNLTDAAYEAHHLIPYQLRTHDVVQLAANAEIPFHINQFENGFKLLKELNGNHTNYNKRMFEVLEDWKSSRRNPTPEDAKKFLEELMDEMRDVINTNPNVGMQDLDF